MNVEHGGIPTDPHEPKVEPATMEQKNAMLAAHKSMCDRVRPFALNSQNVPPKERLSAVLPEPDGRHIGLKVNYAPPHKGVRWSCTLLEAMGGMEGVETKYEIISDREADFPFVKHITPYRVDEVVDKLGDGEAGSLIALSDAIGRENDDREKSDDALMDPTVSRGEADELLELLGLMSQQEITYSQL